jgi:hypothetical protein
LSLTEVIRGVRQRCYHAPYNPGNPDHIASVRHSLSHERLTSYDRRTDGDRFASLELYEWNTDASAACYATLQAVEVVLRNAIHDQLTALHRARGRSGTWLDDPAHLLEPRRRTDILDARRRVARQRRLATPGRLIAELPFGFWRFLLSARYEQSLWTPALRHAFPHLRPQRRRIVAGPMERLHHLRNRIAHHEPIHDHDLAAYHDDMLTVVGAICPYTCEWMASRSELPSVIAVRPTLPVPWQSRYDAGSIV